MSPSNHSTAPLNRWKSRFWVFTKPMFWTSSFLLLSTGLLIADYYRVSASPDELEAASDFDLETSIENIPLSDDPELQELRGWEIAEDTNDSDVVTDPDLADQDLDAIANELDDQEASDSGAANSGGGSATDNLDLIRLRR